MYNLFFVDIVLYYIEVYFYSVGNINNESFINNAVFLLFLSS